MFLLKSAFVWAFALTSSVTSLNILLTNDDSWASANIRATFDALVHDGHDVVLVGPAVQQSGRGGTFVLPTTNITAPGGEFDSIPVGAPFFGRDVTNANLFYFNGTPAATAAFAFDVILPTFFPNMTLDLVVSGPNEGQNNGPFLYTLSGTIGAAYFSVERGFPAIALSAGNGTHRSFTTNTNTTDDPANIAGRLTANLVAALANNVTGSLLPVGVGISVNFPTFGPGNNCTEPPFILTRMTGGATIDKVGINNETGWPESTNILAPGLNTALNGVSILGGETPVSAQCQTSVSIFSVDYDAPSEIAQPVQMQLLPIIGSTALLQL